MYAVITENDVSKWNDQTGVKYHFPAKYKGILKPGTKVIYYKGKLTDKAYENKRLSNSPHYFGQAIIGAITQEIGKSNYYAEILEYLKFPKAVLARSDDMYLEVIPKIKEKSYWRDGVRKI